MQVQRTQSVNFGAGIDSGKMGPIANKVAADGFNVLKSYLKHCGGNEVTHEIIPIAGYKVQINTKYLFPGDQKPTTITQVVTNYKEASKAIKSFVDESIRPKVNLLKTSA